MKCPKCQSENLDKRKFCRECGTKLLSICPQCAAENPPDDKFCGDCGHPLVEPALTSPAASSSGQLAPSVPTSFANGRYHVRKFLGEGGKKKVFLAHDTVLDRDVAFALIKTEKLDETARTRIKREAQAMGRLGDHPNIVTVFDFGDHEAQPYMVLPLLSGGDVEGLIKKAPDHKLPIEQSIEIAKSVCKGLQFAHAKGIIHRDIKPGNVWMTSDGAAKVGDFGLAVAVDRSRLTQVGMMVGTVSYMPPEQAMGGQVTAKADLYSLGAMLYEMVTGRPPFVGDDSVAIIGQHINTPPISPSWHRAALPPGLETLIMQLLEKDPGKRPASAMVVLQALESISAGKDTKAAPDPKAAPAAENPLYRRVFVGREQELKQLQAAFDGAISGQGALWMVLGEPGVGKTAVCEQLATYVTLRGGRTLVGHCYEEGSLSLPYLAFVEAMRSYVLDRDPADLKKELGTGATDVARIVSEIREKLDVKPRPGENPEEDRYRLLQAVASFLTHAGSVKPLLVVLEDLHDADKGTLEMLTYVSRNLGGARLLIIGTYRDVEVDRTHPLSAALAELRRVSTFGRVLLRGLNADEVRRMLESVTQESVPWSLAEAVHRQTEGNPLFVQEVVRYLVEQKLLVRSEGRMAASGSTPVEMSIPEGLRDVIGKRLSFLNKECNELLSVASVIGREFAIETLRTVANINEDVFVNALKEAVRLTVLEERSQVGEVRYRFTHAFFRQTLYEEMIAPQRLTVHHQVARALETLYTRRLEEHATELTEHFSQSIDPPDLAKAVSYGQMAAKRAMDVYAYGEAVRLLDQAVKVQRVLDPGDRSKICDLLLDLSDALLAIPDNKRVIEAESPAAFALAESLGDGMRAVRSCIQATFAVGMQEGLAGVVSPRFEEWIARADRYARPDTQERAFADWMVGSFRLNRRDRRAGLALLRQALELSRKLSDRDVFQLAAGYLIYLTTPQDAQTRALADELFASTESGINPFLAPLVFTYAIAAFLMAGQRGRAEQLCDKLRVLAERTGRALLRVLSGNNDAAIAVIGGRFEEALERLTRMRALNEELGMIATFGDTDFRYRVYLGASLKDYAVALSPGSSFAVVAHWCQWQAHLGIWDEVTRALDEFVVKRPSIGTSDDLTPAATDTCFLEASVLAGHREAARLLLERLSRSAFCTGGTFTITCIPRHLGGAAALLGRHDEARQHYHEAIKVCTEMRFRPELALSRLQLAELLLDHYPSEKKDALEHLDFAIKEFREMKMQPSLERALRRKEILKA